MKRRIFSLALTLSLLVSAVPAAYAVEEAESTWDGTPVAEDAFGILAASESRYTAPDEYVEDVQAPTTYGEVYDRMAALKAIYPEGLAWTNYLPYGSSGELGSAYAWKGGSIKGANSGVGCAAFAFILSDAAFGSLPARVIDNGGFTYDDVRVGDILRVNHNSHFVIVLQKSSAGVTVAEANYNSSVHWGRAMSEAEVMSADFIVTRYPKNFTPADSEDADKVVQQGTEESLSWTLTKAGVLTISGNGAMPDYSLGEDTRPPWDTYKEDISTIILEDGVTSIGDYAFYMNPALSVYIPDSVVRIGEGAFRQSSDPSTGLLAVTIPGSVKTIGKDAFRYCRNISSVTIADGVTTVGDTAFQGCTSLTHIDFPASVTSVGSGAFMSCSEMTRVRFVPGTKKVEVGDNLFTQCWNLVDVTLPQTLDRIGEGMFESCISLTKIYIPGDVSEIGANAFTKCERLQVEGIYFGGSETDWNAIGGNSAIITLQPYVVKVYYNTPFDDPFAKDPNDPGDFKPNDPVVPGPGDEGEDQGHSWAEAWSRDSSSHWHECLEEDCTITLNSEKDGYGAHTYGAWVIDQAATAAESGSRHRTCTVCGYEQTESIPAAGSTGNSGGSSSSGSSSSGTTSTTTTKNPDGSTTTTTTNKRTGTVTASTRNPDGSQTVVETKADGTVTTQKTDAEGNQTKTVVNPDGSSVVSVEQANGVTATVSAGAAGTTAEVRLSAAVVQASQQSGEAVALPIPETALPQNGAARITVNTGSAQPVKVEIPAAAPGPGTVAVIVHGDGTEEIVKTSVPTAGGVVLSLSDGTAVKLMDNSKAFADVAAQNWAANAVAFVSARELFSGTTETTFAPDLPMTRAMLVTVLARLEGVDTSSGTTWYEKGLEWAEASGISDGSSPEQSITREQLVTMLWRYKGAPAGSGGLSGFADAVQVSDYAQEAMGWAVENGIVSGFQDGTLGPQGQATRAQVAQMLMNFIEQ